MSITADTDNSAIEQSNPTTENIVFTVEQIHQLLPHRHPFALVDRVIEYIPGQKAVGIKNVTYNEPFFPGHIPARALMPGVLMVEAMAQVGGIILTQMPGLEGKFFAFAGIDGVRFRRPVVPGDRLILTVELLSLKRNRIAKMQGQGTVDGELAVRGEMLFSLID